MSIWTVIGALLLTLGVSPRQLAYLSTVEIVDSGDAPRANIARSTLVDNKIIPQKKNNSSLGVKISAPSAAVMDESSGTVLWQKSAQEPRPIASISKLMTALVWLEYRPDWDQIVTVSPGDIAGGDTPNIVLGEQVRARDLFYTSLIASDNNATLALVRSTGMSQEDFVELMNAKAKELGLSRTTFVEPVGLDAGNRSTALEVLQLARIAFADKDIAAASALASYEFTALSGQTHQVKSTNNLLKSFLSVKNGKTGSTEQAGYCLVVRVAGSAGQKILTVVLGSVSHEERFQDAKVLSAWTLENFLWL